METVMPSLYNFNQLQFNHEWRGKVRVQYFFPNGYG
jgi:hypothetical protein